MIRKLSDCLLFAAFILTIFFAYGKITDKTWYHEACQTNISSLSQSNQQEQILHQLSSEVQKAEKEGSAEKSFSPASSKSVSPASTLAISPEEKEKAIHLLTSIPLEKLGLYSDLSNYDLEFAATTTDVDGKSCYNVQAVNLTSMRHEIMGMYFVTTDETAVYKYDVLTGDCIPIDIS